MKDGTLLRGDTSRESQIPTYIGGLKQNAQSYNLCLAAGKEQSSTMQKISSQGSPCGALVFAD